MLVEFTPFNERVKRARFARLFRVSYIEKVLLIAILNGNVVPLRVLLADDQTLIRAGLCAVLSEIPGVTVVAEAGDGHEALTLIEQHEPDIALIDVLMPKLGGIEVATRSVKRWPHIRILMLSGLGNENYIVQALRAGAVGYVVKDCTTAELHLALQAIMKGEKYLSPTASKGVLDDYLRRIEDQTSVLDGLTSRQREVLQLIAEGHSTKEIADVTRTSVKTVEAHRARLMARLGLHDIAGLVRFAIRAGLISDDR